jgi:exopolysaccharide production protein ExoZ
MHVVSVQILRAIAALMIVILHAFYDAETLVLGTGVKFVAPNLPLNAGVDLFFVISGFVMVVASRNLFETSGGYAVFLKRRIARIVPLYWVVTSVFIIIAWLKPDTLNSAFPGPADVVKSFLFIPYLKAADDLVQPIYKLGWTLNYEMMFYFAFALVIALPMQRALQVLSLGFAALVLAGHMLALSPGAIWFWTSPIIMEFVAGMWIGYALLKGVRFSAPAGMACIMAGVALLAAFHVNDLGNSAWRAIGFGIPAALVVAGTALGCAEIRASKLVIWTAALGDASYALYLCHPFAVRLLRLVWERTGMGTSLGPWVYVCAATATASLAALLIYRTIEQPMTARIQSLLGTISAR